MIKKIALALIALIVILVAVGFVLPSKVEVAREITIEAPPDKVFAVVNRLDRFQEWSPWYEYDPGADYKIEGPENGGVGQVLSWQSEHEQVGSGRQEIVESIENQKVRTALDFGDMGQASAAFNLVPEGDATRVTWSFETDVGGNPLMRYMGLMMDGWVGADYEKGLASLKGVVERD